MPSATEPSSNISTTERSPLRFACVLLVYGIIYSILAWLSLEFAGEPRDVAPIWMPAGFYFFALLRAAPKDRWAIIATFFVFQTGIDLAHGRILYATTGYFVASTIRSVVGVWFFERFSAPPWDLRSIRQLLYFLAGPVVIACLLSALVGATFSSTLAYGKTWLNSFQIFSLGGMLGVFLLGPAFMIWSEPKAFQLPALARIAEAVLITIGLLCVGNLLFHMGNSFSPTLILALHYAVFPLLVWGSLRFGPQGVSAWILMLVFDLIIETLADRLSITNMPGDPVANMLALQMFLSAAGLVGFVLASDVASRQTAEANLDAVQQYNSFVVSHAPTIICALDMNGRTVSINPAGERITGYKAAELAGIDWWTTFYPGELFPQVETLFRVFTHGGVRDYEMTLRTKSGELRTISWTSANRFNEEGQLYEVVGIGTDVTERNRSIEELQRAKESAEAANRAKSVFLSNMSHELRTPLNAVIGYASLLLRSGDSLSEKQRRYSQFINDSGQHLLKLIDNILDLSRIESGRVATQLSWFTLSDTLSKVASFMQGVASQRQLTLSTDVDDVGNVFLDESKIRQVVINLLDNATKFTPAGGKIGLKLTRRDAEVVISVWDTGIGIEPQNHELIFGQFQQVEDTFTRRYQGSGLGLSIARQLVEIQGGKIAIQSGLGEGSCFEVSFPTKKCQPNYRQPSSVLLNATDEEIIELVPGNILMGKRVLVVEDNLHNRLLVTSLLKEVGALVCEAATGQEAVARYTSERPELVLLDIQLPDIDGFEVLRRINGAKGTNPQPPPVIALTAFAMQEERDSLLRAGVQGYISKPIDVETFLATVIEQANLMEGQVTS